MVQYCSKKNSASISRVLYHIGTLELLAPLKLLMVASIINLESRITTCFCCFLPSNSREQRSNVGILGIAAHSVVVSPAQGRLVSVAGTKHYCLTAVNRCGALCCPDFPLPMRLRASALSFPQQRQTDLLISSRGFAPARERCTGIEPASSAWEADALPMC